VDGTAPVFARGRVTLGEGPEAGSAGIAAYAARPRQYRSETFPRREGKGRHRRHLGHRGGVGY